jgi:ribose transport system permease protein
LVFQGSSAPVRQVLEPKVAGNRGGSSFIADGLPPVCTRHVSHSASVMLEKSVAKDEGNWGGTGQPGKPTRIRLRRYVDLVLSEGLLLAFILLVAVFALRNPLFLSSSNVVNILRQTAEIGIGAAGQTIVILIAGIDLSVGSVLALSGLAAAILATQGVLFGSLGLPPELAMIAALCLGTSAGVVNGLAVTQLRIAPIIVTLAAMTYLRGIVYTWSNGVPIYSGLPDLYAWIGSGYLGGTIPVPVVILLVVYAILWFVLNRTVFGTHLFAIGGNSEAARLAGVPVKRVTVLAYAICAFTAALAGVMVMGRVHSAQPLAGNGWELDTITAVALGGVSLFGGRGSLLKVFLASLTLAVLSNGFVLMGLSPYAQMIIKGLILLLAVGFDVLLNRRKRAARG